MDEHYIINLEKLKSYSTDLKNEHNYFTNLSRKTISNGYLYNCSDSSIVSMRNKIDTLYSNIDNGYKNINIWLNGYIDENNNLELSLKNGMVSGINDHETNIVLNNFVDKNNVNIAESPDIINKMNNYSNVIYDDRGFELNVSVDDIDVNFQSYLNVLDQYYEKYKDLIPIYGEGVIEVKVYIDIFENNRVSLTEELNTLKSEREALYREFDKYNFTNRPAGVTDAQAYEMQSKIRAEIEDYNNKIEEQESLLVENNFYLTKLNTTYKLLPYEKLLNEQSFIDFYNSYDVDKLYEIQSNSDKDYDYLNIIEYYFGDIDYENDSPDVIKQKMKEAEETIKSKNLDYFKIGFVDNEITALDFYKYTSNEQKMIYHYLLEKEGEESANKYVDLLTDEINKAKGYEYFLEFKDEFEYFYNSERGMYGEGDFERTANAVAAWGIVKKQGIGDGLQSFVEGIVYTYEAISGRNSGINYKDYATALIANYLSEETYAYDFIYSFNYTVGRSMPVIAASILASYIVTPAGCCFAYPSATTLGRTVGMTLSGISSGGTAYHEAYINGHDQSSSLVYGILVGASDALISRVCDTTIPGWTGYLGNNALTICRDIFKGGVEEGIQAYFVAGAQATVLDENIDWGNVSDEALSAFLLGALMTGGTKVRSRAIDRILKIPAINNRLNEIKRKTKTYKSDYNWSKLTPGEQALARTAGLLDTFKKFEYDINVANLPSLDNYKYSEIPEINKSIEDITSN